MSGAVDNLTKNPYVFVGGVIVLGVAAYLLVKKIGSDIKEQAVSAAKGVGGVVSGDNAITSAARTDAYKGKGIFGTLGAGTDILFGGALSSFGEWSAGKLFDWTHTATPSTANQKLDITNVLFPNGARYSVSVEKNKLTPDGKFNSGGVNYQLKINQANQTVAVPV